GPATAGRRAGVADLPRRGLRRIGLGHHRPARLGARLALRLGPGSLLLALALRLRSRRLLLRPLLGGSVRRGQLRGLLVRLPLCGLFLRPPLALGPPCPPSALSTSP